MPPFIPHRPNSAPKACKTTSPKVNTLRDIRPRPLGGTHPGRAEQSADGSRRAFELISPRKTYRKLAARLGVSARTVQADMEACWEELPARIKAQVERLRKRDLEALEEMKSRRCPLAPHPGSPAGKASVTPSGKGRRKK